MGVRQLDSLLALPDLKELTWDPFLVYNTDGLISSLLAHHLLSKDAYETKTYGKKIQEGHRKPEGYCTTEFSCSLHVAFEKHFFAISLITGDFERPRADYVVHSQMNCSPSSNLSLMASRLK